MKKKAQAVAAALVAMFALGVTARADEWNAGIDTDNTDLSKFLFPQELHVLPLAANVELAGTAGSIRINHDCGYGGLSGKAVSIEPSTGFTFETPLVPRLH